MLKVVCWAGSVPFPPVSLQRQVVCLLLRPVFMFSSQGRAYTVSWLVGVQIKVMLQQPLTCGSSSMLPTCFPLTPHPTPLQNLALASRIGSRRVTHRPGASVEELSGGRSSGPDHNNMAEQPPWRAIQPPKLPRFTGEADGCDADEFIQEAERVLRNYRMEDGTAVEWIIQALEGSARREVITRAAGEADTANLKTVGDAYPLPRIQESLDALVGAQYFSTLDLASGYHQISMDPRHQHKTAFTTPFGLYEYTRMPMGLASAPATFQRLMQASMSDFAFQFLLVYLDDLLVYSKTFDEHMEHLERLLQRVTQTGLKLKASKCQFLRREVTYLGHTISADGVSCESGKVECMQNWPTPTTTTELCSFLGFASYYRRFITG